MSKEGKILTIEDLTKRVVNEWEKKRKEAQEEEGRLKKQLEVAVKEEKEITGKLSKAKKVVSQMEQEYLKIESKLETEKRKQIESSSIKEEDVKSGKVKLKDFLKAGKTNKQIAEETVKRVTEELSQALKVIRAKNLEIMTMEKELAEVQIKIRQLIIAPGKILQQKLKELKEFTDSEMGLFLADIHSSRTQLESIKNKLNLTQGKALTPGYRWPRCSPEAARAIQFDPILPKELVSSLLEQLEANKDKETVCVNFTLGRGESPGFVDVDQNYVIRIPQDKMKVMNKW